jgi:membrane protein DedA with SNARE-associated domain
MTTDALDAARPDRRPPRWAVTLVAVPLVGMIVASNVGDAAAPDLVVSHPALLLALNARNRNLVLVTNQLDAVTYYGIGLARLVASDPLFFLLGWWYGDAAVTWMEKRTRTWGKTLRKAEGWFHKGAYPLLFVAPNQYICLFAGAAGIPVAAFLVVNVSGTLVRLYLVRRFGDVFEGPIDDVVAWIGDHRVPLLGVSVGLVLLSLALEARKGETEVTALVHLDDELEEAAADNAARGEGERADGAPAAADDDGHGTDVPEAGPPAGRRSGLPAGDDD